MAHSSPRLNPRPAVASGPRSPHPPAAAPRPPVPTPPGAAAARPDAAVTVLVAGVDKDTRTAVEATVRGAFTSRPAGEPWTVSLVQLGGTWSVRLEGPRALGQPVSFMVDASRLVERLRAAIETGAASPSAERGVVSAQPAGTSAVDAVRDPHACERCQRGFVVVYELQPDEVRVRAAVACPHCWTLNFVEVGDWAAAGHDYRAEKA